MIEELDVFPHNLATGSPLIVGDKIWFYYQGMKGRHWFKHHNDPLEGGFGLATLRLDGFVSVCLGDIPPIDLQVPEYPTW